MAGFLPQADINNLRCVDLLVADRAQAVADMVLNLRVNNPTVIVPKDHAGRLFLEMEQIQLPGDSPVVTFFCFFQVMQIGAQLFFTGPGRTIYPLQHFIVAVSAPIGSGQLGKLELTKVRCIGHVWTTAEVYELTLPIQ
jgi:hypothetical protein